MNLKYFKMNVKTIAFLGVYLAIMIIMNFTPQLGYINFGGGNTITLMLVPVILVTLHYGWKGALFGWTVFGLLSLAATPIYSPSVLNLFGVGGTFTLFVCGRLSAMVIICLIIYVMRDLLKWSIWLQAIIIGIFTPFLNTMFVLGYAAAWNATSFLALLATSGVNIGVEFGISIPVSIAMVPLVKYLVSIEEGRKKNEY